MHDSTIPCRYAPSLYIRLHPDDLTQGRVTFKGTHLSKPPPPVRAVKADFVHHPQSKANNTATPIRLPRMIHHVITLIETSGEEQEARPGTQDQDFLRRLRRGEGQMQQRSSEMREVHRSGYEMRLWYFFETWQAAEEDQTATVTLISHKHGATTAEDQNGKPTPEGRTGAQLEQGDNH